MSFVSIEETSRGINIKQFYKQSSVYKNLNQLKSNIVLKTKRKVCGLIHSTVKSFLEEKKYESKGFVIIPQGCSKRDICLGWKVTLCVSSKLTCLSFKKFNPFIFKIII